MRKKKPTIHSRVTGVLYRLTRLHSKVGELDSFLRNELWIVRAVGRREEVRGAALALTRVFGGPTDFYTIMIRELAPNIHEAKDDGWSGQLDRTITLLIQRELTIQKEREEKQRV